MTDVEIEFDVPVPMRDGTILRADVYRPTGPGPWPVLVQRTSYDKRSPAGGLPLATLRPARQRIFHDASRASHIALPVVSSQG